MKTIAHIQWDAIKNDYVRGYDDGFGNRNFPSQRDLAEKYGVAPASIGRKASKEQWAVQREQFSSRISDLCQQKLAEVISDEGCDFSLKVYNLADKLADKIESMIDLIEDSKDINQLTTALKNVQSVVGTSLGDKTADDNTVEINVKLENEKE